MQKTRGAALLAATLVAVCGLAACGDEGSEASASSSTASPSAPEKEASSEASESDSGGSEPETSSPDSSELEASDGEDESESDGEVTELPAAAKKKTKAGAIAFNEFYQVQVGEALKTGSTTTLEKHSSDCQFCDGMIQRVKDHAEKGVHMNKNPNTVRDLSATKRKDGGYRVEMTIDASEYHEVLPDGSKGRSADALSMTVVTDTQWENGGWVMHEQARTE